MWARFVDYADTQLATAMTHGLELRGCLAQLRAMPRDAALVLRHLALEARGIGEQLTRRRPDTEHGERRTVRTRWPRSGRPAHPMRAPGRPVCSSDRRFQGCRSAPRAAPRTASSSCHRRA